jgi:hypothetical protein
MTGPRSSGPIVRTVMANTIVRPMAVPSSARAARNLPTTTSQSRTGIVESSSSVPLDFSSASRRIVMAGTTNMNMNGMKANSSRRSACFCMKSCEKNR